MRILVRQRDGSRRACGGFIVVAVLWIVIALATLASVFSIYLANSATAVAVNDVAVERQLLVSSGLELAAYQQSVGNQGQNQGESRKPTRGSFGLRLGHARVAVSYVAETARIDLNAAPKEMLTGLLAALGAPIQDAEFYAERIVGWRTAPKPEDANNEEIRYRAAGLSYGPRGAPFTSVDELWLVLGLPASLVERIMPFVTIFSGHPYINVFDAAPQVIAALPGVTPAQLNILLNRRDDAPADANFISQLLGSNRAGATADGTDAIRVMVRIAFDNGQQMASEVVILVGADEEPYRVLSWRDDKDVAATGQRISQEFR